MRFFANFWFKILAAFLAVCFWFFLVSFQNVIIDFEQEYEIELRNKSVDYDVPYALPKVKLKLAVPRDELNLLRKEDFVVFIDLEKSFIGEEMLNIEVESLKNTVRVISFSPETVSVVLEEKLTKTFLIDGFVDGDPAEGYSVIKTSVNPKEVVISGLRSAVDSIKSVRYKIVLEGKEKETFSKSQYLVAFDENGIALEEGLKFSPETVEVQVYIIENDSAQ